MDIKKCFLCAQSKGFKIVLGVLGTVIILMIFFCLGMVVGFHRANFSRDWSENYHRNFAGPQNGFFAGVQRPGKEYMDPHGIFGQIIKVGPNDIIIDGQGTAERIISIDDDTTIRSLRNNIKLTDLKIGNSVVVIGEPNSDGQIEAKLIRLMPAIGCQPSDIGCRVTFPPSMNNSNQPSQDPNQVPQAPPINY